MIDADHPNDPTFATADDVFAGALATEADALDAPAEPESCERHEGEGWVEYEVRVGSDQHLTWGVT